MGIKKKLRTLEWLREQEMKHQREMFESALNEIEEKKKSKSDQPLETEEKK